jgi:pimeloyl-ACP methyl ester carboxylesterase
MAMILLRALQLRMADGGANEGGEYMQAAISGQSPSRLLAGAALEGGIDFSAMSGARPTTARPLACAALAVVLLLLGSSGCSYLKWRREKKEQRSELAKSPGNLILEKEYAPQDCYGLVGRVAVPAAVKGSLLVAAFQHASPAHELVGSREVVRETGYYGLLLPAGTYDLAFFADLNGDGFFEADEVIGRTPPDAPVTVGAAESKDGVSVLAPNVALDLARPSSAEAAVRVKTVPIPFVVESVDDPIFAPEMGEIGVYQPIQFLAKTQSWFFSVGIPDFSKVQVVLVHGIDGTPRDFRSLVPSLDRSRYQIWLFYYPSGLRLDQVGAILAHGVDRVAAEGKAKDLRVAIVAHSMGGLVGRRAVNELCKAGKPPYLRLYASFDTPYGGVESAAGAVKRGTELVPSWVDVAAGSPFLTRLYETPLPKDLPFHLFFGWGANGNHGPSPAGDGTIALPSQLDPRVQAAASRMMGYGDTHVGILADADALKELSRVLEATTAAGKS